MNRYIILCIVLFLTTRLFATDICGISKCIQQLEQQKQDFPAEAIGDFFSILQDCNDENISPYLLDDVLQNNNHRIIHLCYILSLDGSEKCDCFYEYIIIPKLEKLPEYPEDPIIKWAVKTCYYKLLTSELSKQENCPVTILSRFAVLSTNEDYLRPKDNNAKLVFTKYDYTIDSLVKAMQHEDENVRLVAAVLLSKASAK